MQAGIRQTSVFAMVALGLVVVFAGTTLAQPGSSNLGTWKLNFAKSTFAPGTAPKSGTFTNVVAGAGITSTSDSVSADGTARHSEYTIVYDGKDNPLTGNSSNGDVVAGTRRCQYADIHLQERWKGQRHNDECRVQRWEDLHHYL
jgi:hypothetical protein